jgi:hypothetical protein
VTTKVFLEKGKKGRSGEQVKMTVMIYSVLSSSLNLYQQYSSTLTDTMIENISVGTVSLTTTQYTMVTELILVLLRY